MTRIDSYNKRLERFKELQHLPVSVIAKEIGVSKETIYKYQEKLGVRKRDARKRSKHLEYRDYLIANKGLKTLKEMSVETGLSIGTLSRYMYDNRLIECNEELGLYHNDDYVGSGTLYELSDLSGINPSMLKFYRSAKRSTGYIVFSLEDED